MSKKIFAWLVAHNTHRHNKLVKKEKALLFQGLRGRILEIGAGTGINLEYYPKDIQYVALEPNVEMDSYLMKEIERQNMSDTKIVRGFAELIPLPDNSMDAVISTLVLCSVKDPEKALGEITRVLKPGGRFLFMEHVAAPRKTFLRTIQHSITPLWKIVADGCNPERETANFILKSGLREIAIKEFSLSIRSVVAPHIVGRAVK